MIGFIIWTNFIRLNIFKSGRIISGEFKTLRLVLQLSESHVGGANQPLLGCTIATRVEFPFDCLYRC